MTPHPWKLVAPWYRWRRQFTEEKRQPRASRPVFQMFDQPDCAKEFTKDLQRSLRFHDETDTVFKAISIDAPPSSGASFSGRMTRLYMLGKDKEQVAKDVVRQPTGVRKLYLPTHKRHYLVVCELHCDLPGFPSVNPDRVCQAGFVVRRRSYRHPPGTKRTTAKLLEAIAVAQAELTYLDESNVLIGRAAKAKAETIQRMTENGSLETVKTARAATLAGARQSLRHWVGEKQIQPVLEGWVETKHAGIGQWEAIEEGPEKVDEAVFPLYPVFPDPLNRDNDATGKAIYFGVVPASSLDVDKNGAARFDDQSLYEIRCFVRRHKAQCPRKNSVPDCHGDIVWSEATEPYKLAAPTDLIGTSQQPITIRMPDLAEIVADLTKFSGKALAPVRVIQPQALNFKVSDGKPEDGGVGGEQVCFYAVALISIVAHFVFKLFLPILMFLFGLFFLLQLKFCIPPSIKMNAQLKAELDAVPPSLDVDADFQLTAQVGLGGTLFNQTELNTHLVNGVGEDLGVILSSNDLGKLQKFSNVPLLALGKSTREAEEIHEQNKDISQLDLTSTLELEVREPKIEVTLA